MNASTNSTAGFQKCCAPTRPRFNTSTTDPGEEECGKRQTVRSERGANTCSRHAPRNLQQPLFLVRMSEGRKQIAVTTRARACVLAGMLPQRQLASCVARPRHGLLCTRRRQLLTMPNGVCQVHQTHMVKHVRFPSWAIGADTVLVIQDRHTAVAVRQLRRQQQRSTAHEALASKHVWVESSVAFTKSLSLVVPRKEMFFCSMVQFNKEPPSQLPGLSSIPPHTTEALELCVVPITVL